MVRFERTIVYISGIIVVGSIIYKVLSNIFINRKIRKAIRDISKHTLEQDIYEAIKDNIENKIANDNDLTALIAIISFLFIILSTFNDAIGGFGDPDISDLFLRNEILWGMRLYVAYTLASGLAMLLWVFIAVISHYVFKILGRRTIHNFKRKTRHYLY